MTVEEQVATLRPAEIAALLVENADLKRQVEWFKRQLFGQKSERRLREPDPQQLSLSGLLTPPTCGRPAAPAHRNRQSLSAARAVV
jgi:transposase